MRASRLIKLNAGRVAQLERIARARSTTIAGAVESLVSDRVTAGEIEAGFPGCKIERLGDLVRIKLDGRDLAPTLIAEATRFAVDLADLAAKTAGAAKLKLLDGTELVAQRNGRGVTLSASGGRLCVSSKMLAEIAAQLGAIAR